MDDDALIGAAVAPAIHVMSWNIRRRMGALTLRTADRWNDRAPRIRALLRAEAPTVFSAQEALPDQVAFVRDCLGEDHAVVGRGRGADGGGEASPIIYDTRQLELLDWRQTALSDQPARPGSTSWGNIVPRALVSASFRQRGTGNLFLVLNTHLDHLSRRSRVRSAQEILRIIAEHGLPAVVTGDLNDRAGGPTLRELFAQGSLVDTWEVARSHASEAWGTFPNYREPRRGGRRLDWILVSPSFQVQTAAVNPRRYHGGWASDHLPVHALMFPPENGTST